MGEAEEWSSQKVQGSERKTVSQHVRERRGEATSGGVDVVCVCVLDHGRGELAGNMICTD